MTELLVLVEMMKIFRERMDLFNFCSGAWWVDLEMLKLLRRCKAMAWKLGDVASLNLLCEVVC